MKLFYSAQQAADLLQISRNTLKTFVTDGLLPAYRINPSSRTSPWRINGDDLLAFAKKHYKTDLDKVK